MAVRRVTTHWGSSLDRKEEGFEYRVSAARQILYRMPVPAAADDSHIVTLLGSDRTGFTSRGGIVVAFDEDTGKEKWRWDGGNPGILPFAALADGSVLVRDHDRYLAVKDGKVNRPYPEDFMLFVMKMQWGAD